MQFHKKLIPQEPTLIDHSTLDRFVYIPKANSLPDLICLVKDESPMTFCVQSKDVLLMLNKTDILQSWFPQEYYDWIMDVFTDYGYLLGWVILEKRHPEYRAFLRMIIKMHSAEVYLIIKDR